MGLPSVYDLLDRFGAEEVRRWLAGEPSALGELPEDVAEQIGSLWAFWARPGQRWTPGPEQVTYYSCGRGWGKTVVLSCAMGEAALEPERWGYEGMLVGITPTDIVSLINQDTGVVRLSETFGFPRPSVRLSPPYSLTFPHPSGSGRGLHVRIASSNKPESARGPNIGILFADEFAFFANVRDEQGYTTWEAADRGLRIGGAKAIIVSSPSRKAIVRKMRDLAERPTCSACGHQLPPSPRRRLSPLFLADTTEPVRACPECSAEVVAEVRMVRGPTLDNRAVYSPAVVAKFERMLATGGRQALGEIGGEILDDDASAPIGSLKIHDLSRLRVGPDRYRSVFEAMGLTTRIVAVDPATTAGESSADTGVIAMGGTRERTAAVGLQDWSVSPREVEGSPSRVWAPRAAILAALWRASAIHVETNQGGLEVVYPVKRAMAALTAADLSPHLSDRAAIRDALRAAQACEVKPVTRRSSKPARWDWASIPARSGDLSLALAPWLDSDHWKTTIEHATRFIPLADKKRGREPIDRGDTLISGAQILLGAREVDSERIVDPSRSPVYTGSLF